MTPHQNADRLEDRVADTRESITARLEGAKNSQAQIRFTLGMMAVISTMMLIASYNAYLSYDYRWIIESNQRQEAEQQGPELKLAAAKEETNSQPPASAAVAKALTDQALRDWASSRIVMISLLGIRVSVDDAAVLGTSILLILSAWLVLWARRENHTIGRLLRETYQRRRYGQDRSVTQSKSGEKLYTSQERWLIFHTINSNSIFLTAYPSLRSINSLEGEIKPPTNDFKRRVNNVLFLFLRYFFLSFPVIATLIVFLIDRMSYFISDPFDPNFDPPGTSPFFWRSMVVFFLCWIPLTVCCLRSIRYSRDTEKVLRQYEDKLKDERAHEYTSGPRHV